MKTATCFAAACALALASCQSSGTSTASTQPDLLRANLDTTVRPGDDFFQYANGAWLQQHPIPASESSWSIGKEVQNEVYARLRSINEEAAQAKASASSNQQKIGDFWATGMDSVAANQQGIAPLQPELQRIAAIQSVPALQAEIARLRMLGVTTPLGSYVSQDDKNSEKMQLQLHQTGLGLPNRDYYFNQDARTTNIRQEYVRHVAKMLQLLGQDSVAAKIGSARIMQLETAMAQSSKKLADLRDPYANYHKMSVAQLDKLTPGLRWQPWLTQLDAPQVDTVIVGQPAFYQTVGQLLQKTPLADWKDYLRWQLVREFADQLSQPIDHQGKSTKR